ncbi:hypothetical protein WSM22_31420 [Cytophagales bacterium WSM2-2]|nr:hypothetical protein WSM22_31420 [Cytophagales bacterium WSM2-2]
MVNLYSLVKNSSHFRKMEIDGLLFVEYKCVMEETRFGVWSDNNYFAYILSGRKMWKSVSRDYDVYPGDILFIKKGANLTQQFFEDEFCAIFLFLPDDFVRSFLQKHPQFMAEATSQPLNPEPVLRIPPDELLESYFSSVASYLSLSKKPNEQLLKLKFEELLLQVCTSAHHQPLKDYFVSLTHPEGHQLSYVMEANYAYNLKLVDFAQLCYLSLSSFKRLFKQQYKTSPAAWILHRKLELALKLLATTDLAVSQISLQCGFEDTSHFIRVFKKKHKITPHQYRLQQRQLS